MPVPTFVTVTLAPAMTAPPGSVTLPTTRPVAVCGDASGAVKSVNTSAATAEAYALVGRFKACDDMVTPFFSTYGCPALSESWTGETRMQHSMNTIGWCQVSCVVRASFIFPASALSAGSQLFLHGAVGLIDGLVGVSSRSRVRICDGDATEALPSNLARRLSLGPFRIPQIVVFVRVAVRPPIHRNGIDVARGIKPTGAQDASKLIPNIALEGRKGCHEQVNVSSALLISGRKPRLTRRPQHPRKDGLFR